jgi:hypothetical protein
MSGNAPLPASIQVDGASVSLFHLAAIYYGDATAWLTIAQANGMSDPLITGLVTLTIPVANPNAGGGVAAQ